MTLPERLEESMSQLSELSSLTLVIVLQSSQEWSYHGSHRSPIQFIRWTTRLLKHVPERARLKGSVRVKFELATIAVLGCPLSLGGPSLEACTALEDAILTLPACDIQFCWSKDHWRRAGRPVFWSLTITSAFPKLNQRGLLTLPHCKLKPHHSD